MIELNGKKICENCFSEVEGKFCTQCGYNAETSGFDPLVLKPGSILRGKYIIGKCLGKGGFGVTYLAYDTKADRKVAIKEFFPFGQALRTEGDPTVSVSTEENAAVFKIGAEKFYEEARLVSRFNGNPNIVSVYEFFYENDTVYFSMEYLSGRTLKDYVQKIGKLTPAQAHLIALNVSNALMAAHSASVLHRDISPDNIMLCNNGEIKLIDFGAARQVIAEHSQTFSVILKPGFAPLEQYQKKGKQGPWTDIYSLGATLYYALTGNIPDDPMSRQEEDETFSENKFNIDEELWAIIRKATMLKIPDRYQDVYALRKDLSGLSYSAEPFVVPDEDKAESERPTFRTATVRTARTSEVSAAAAAVQPAPEIQENKSGSRKKAIIGIACGAAAVVAAAVILVIALNSGKPNPGEMVDNGEMNNSSAYSLPDVKEITILGETYSTDLTELTLSEKGLKDSDVKDLKYMKNLTYLYLHDNDLTDISFVKEMPNLVYLDIGINNISDISAIKGLSKLEILNFYANNVSDISAVKGLSKLEMLFLGANYVSDISPLAGLKMLNHVSLDSNMISDVSPLKDCESISTLILDDNNITEKSIDTFAGLTIKEALWLEDNGLTQGQVDRIAAKLNGSPIYGIKF